MTPQDARKLIREREIRLEEENKQRELEDGLRRTHRVIESAARDGKYEVLCNFLSDYSYNKLVDAGFDVRKVKNDNGIYMGINISW